MFSDHSPLCINIMEHKDKCKKPFKFYNCLAQHHEFEDRVKKGWQLHGRGMQGVWKNLNKIKLEMQQLNYREFKDVSDRVTKLRKELEDKQQLMKQAPNPQVLREKEKDIKVKLNK